tara:strand:- start:16520 stop:16939 length:420 start_codon:yes stop_codon:yes gene_type:complete
MEVLITNCSDSSYWYSRSLGEAFKLIKEDSDMYWVRDHNGYRNIIAKSDAIPLSDEPLYNSIAAKRKTSDGSTAEYYELPAKATQLQHLISAKDMNAQIGEVFRTCYRYGECSHSDKLREAKKIKFYADAEIERLSNED